MRFKIVKRGGCENFGNPPEETIEAKDLLEAMEILQGRHPVMVFWVVLSRNHRRNKNRIINMFFKGSLNNQLPFFIFQKML